MANDAEKSLFESYKYILLLNYNKG